MNNLLIRDVKYLDEQYRIGEGIISDDALKQLEKLFIPIDPEPDYFNQKNKKLILSINCDKNELDVRIPGRKWKGGEPPKEEFEKNLINDFC